MARAKTPQRILPLDPKHNSVDVTRLINYIMQKGKKALARRIVYKSLDIVAERAGAPALEVLAKAEEYITPQIELIGKRVGGANLQIPIPVREPRKKQLFLRLLLQAAHSRRERTMDERLAGEIIDASKGEGGAVKKRMGMDKSASSHKAYAHFR